LESPAILLMRVISESGFFQCSKTICYILTVVTNTRWLQRCKFIKHNNGCM
jgi:hypothetical protein